MSELYIMNMVEVNIFVIAREQRDRGDPVSNKVARIRVRALFTGLLRCAAHDKGVWSLFVSCHREGSIAVVAI